MCRPTRRSCTSSASCATRRRSPRSSARSSRELSLAARVRGPPGREHPPARHHDADGGDGRERARRAHRPDPDPARRPRHGRRDARADADRPGLASRPVPRRADPPPGRVLQQAARLGDRRPVPDPRSDARDRRERDRRDRCPEALGCRHAGPHQARQPDRSARGRRGRPGGPPGRPDPLPRRSTAG